MTDYDTLFSDLLGDIARTANLTQDGALFPVDVESDDENFYIEASLPGVAKEDIVLNYADEVLTISAKYDKTKTKPKEKTRLVSEIRSYASKRLLNLPGVDPSSATVSLENGILSVVLKKTAKKSAINIPIK